MKECCKKEVLKKNRKELEFLERNYANFTWEGLGKAINPLQKRLAFLRVEIEKGEAQ